MKLRLLLIYCLLSCSLPAWGKAGYALRLGPPSVGQGGPNPITFSPVEYQLQYVHANNLEANASFTGLFLGKRYYLSDRTYVSLGGGLVLSANGGGFGVYSAFGADFFCGKAVCMSAEYTKALGFANVGLISPYGVRIGASLWL